MNTKLYSLFVFICLIIVYCATVQGSKDNGKNGVYELKMIKKKHKKNNKDNKHVQRAGEDEDEDDNIEFYINYKSNKDYTNLVKEEEKRNEEVKRLSKMHKAYTLGMSTIIFLSTLFLIRDCVLESISRPDSYISQFIKKRIDNKYKKA
ncbi:conserved rodent malaria protein, unknown function [Plasmodium yoelii]|uniref:Conserved rodent malaria protein n=2 Tax=Plasmodium yoelii TaxID=5861 RepID=A0AAF0B208_PLAYO|nr:conserved rodent malaria protein, unknown function [Plasmodium yoelii]WBY54419.1 conserved rodent malaria protein [Plasmodium yoelii yoelii]CDU15843.1 conserved rodent malaria protein, unknown function [Plasmodium yoelii]VTZ71438.1 conserved rodent malaria protein, unknown function [Plasmodium yoelii]|eukprot:XP_022811217.1 conserved rodent malaria protein, unknown function [Plasmodium yoelii]